MGDPRNPPQAGGPAVNQQAPTQGPPVTLLQCANKGGGVEVRLHLDANKMFHSAAAGLARQRHRSHLEAILARLDPAVFAPAEQARQAAAQAAEVRAEADRTEREMHRVRAAISNVKANLQMPGVEKLANERRLNQRLVELNGIHQGNVRDAAELERRAGEYNQEVSKLCQAIAREAVGRAAKAMTPEADRELRRWAADFPAVALLVVDYNGMGQVDDLAAELHGRLSAEPDAEMAPTPAGLDLFGGPDGGVGGPSRGCPTCLAGMHWSHRHQRWHCVECGTVLADPVQAEVYNARPARPVGVDRVVPDGRPDVAPDDPMWDQTRPSGVDHELTRRVAPKAPLVQLQFPFFENWPPPEGADPSIDAPLSGPHIQVAAGSDGTEFDPYTVAQRAQAEADRIAARTRVVDTPASPAMTDAPPTTQFDRTNGGWNGPPTGAQATNGSPFAPGEVDAVLRSLGPQGGQAGGPAVELGPDEFPGV